MARMLPRSKKTIFIFLLIGNSSFYVYQQFGGQNRTKKERSPGIQQDTSGQEESLGMSSGENGRGYVGDKHGMKWRPVLRKGAHFEMDSSNLDVRKKAVPVKLDSINNQAKKLKAKYTGGKNVAEKRTHRNRNDEFRKTKPNRVNRGRKQSNRHSNEKKRSPRRGREGRKYQKNQPNGGTDGKNPPGRERGDVTNYSGETHDKSRIHIQYGEVNTRKVKPVKPINDLQQDFKIENKQQNKKLCNITFEYGQMCPTLYTDLGGYCKIDKKVPGGFDCPDIRRKGYNKLRSTQLVLTRLLKIFDLVARKHDIKYWITSGTLLGAARHRGFIPWDEDADIEMTLDEYIKLFKCCKNDFPEGIFFQSSETDPYLKSQNETENRLLRHPVVGLYRRLWNPRLRDTKSRTKFCLAYGCGWADGLMIDIFIAEDTMHPYHLSRVFPLKEMLFEGFRFPVPGNWRKILQYKYGDYNKELGEYDERIPEDNSDPFHSCEELKQANNG